MQGAGPGERVYDAFISYGHAADGRLAPELQRALSRLGKAWYQRRALHVYRDKTGLSANTDLWAAIRDALDRSRWFVLLASPAAAASHWVGQEVAHWRERHGGERILLVITDGDWAWDADRRDFDWERSTAIPQALEGAFTSEPLAVDLRWAHSSADLDDRGGAFRDAVAELAAAIHGVPKDELVGDDLRQHRRALRLAWSAAIVLGVLALAAVGAGWVARQNAQEADRRRSDAVSRQLAAAATSEQATNLDRALLLAVEAWAERETPEARSALLRALEHQPRFAGALWPDEAAADALSLVAVTFSPDGRQVAAAARRYLNPDLAAERSTIPDDGFDRVLVWDVASGDVAWAAELDDHAVEMWFLENGELVVQTTWSGLVRLSEDGRDELTGPDAFSEVLHGGRRALTVVDGTAELVDTAGGEVLAAVPGAALGSPVECSPDERWCSVLRQRGGLTVLDARSGRRVDELDGAWSRDSAAFVAVAFDPAGGVITVDEADGVRWWRRGAGGYTPTAMAVPEPVAGWSTLGEVATVDDGATLLTLADGEARLWDRRTGALTRSFPAISGEPLLSEDGSTLLVGGYQEGAALYEMASGAVLDREPRFSVPVPGADRIDDLMATIDAQDFFGVAFWDLAAGRRTGVDYGAVSSVEWAPDDRYAISVGQELLFWDLESGQPIPAALEGHPGGADEAAVAPDGSLVAAVGGRTALTLWVPEQRVAPDAGSILGQAGVAPSFDPGSGLVARVQEGAIVVGPHHDLHRGRALRPVEVNGLWGGSLDTPDLELLLAAGGDRLLVVEGDERALWDVETGELVNDSPGCGADRTDSAVASPDGRWLLDVGENGADEVRVCDARTGELETTLEAPPLGNRFASGVAVAPSPDGSLVAIGGEEGDVWVVDLDGERRARTRIGDGDVLQNAIRSLAWSPEGDRLAIGTLSGSVSTWSWEDGGAPVPVSTLAAGRADAVAFSPDRRFLAFGGLDVDHARIVLWDLVEDVAVGDPLQGSLVDLRRLAFSTDGEELVGTDSSGRVNGWAVSADDWVDRACDLAGRDLSAGERQRYLGDEDAVTAC